MSITLQQFTCHPIPKDLNCLTSAMRTSSVVYFSITDFQFLSFPYNFIIDPKEWWPDCHSFLLPNFTSEPFIEIGISLFSFVHLFVQQPCLYLGAA